jgi:dihydropteroate synthase
VERVRFNIVSNLTNGVGLSQDSALLRLALEARGHEVQGLQRDVPVVQSSAAHSSDVNISVDERSGHALHEAPGMGAVVITTDASPMNESPAALLIPSHHTFKYNHVLLHNVSREAMYAAVERALDMNDAAVAHECPRARTAFSRDIQALNCYLDAVVGQERVQVPAGVQ